MDLNDICNNSITVLNSTEASVSSDEGSIYSIILRITSK